MHIGWPCFEQGSWTDWSPEAPAKTSHSMILWEVHVEWVEEKEQPLSKPADDTKLSSAVDIIEGRDAIKRHLDKLEKWVPVSWMWLCKSKFKVLHLSQGNPRY